MAEFTYNPVQAVPLNQGAIFNTSIRCPKGYVVHDEESGVLTLRGIVNNPCGTFARYKITANCNISVPTGGTAGPIAVALTLRGEPRLTSRAIVTPAAVDEYFNVTSTCFVTVPTGCCVDCSLRNVSPANEGDATTITPAPVINMQNLNITVERVA